jgi:hypothetical protein
MVIFSFFAMACTQWPTQLFSWSYSKEVHLPFHLSIGPLFCLLISIDRDFCGHLQKLAGIRTSKPLKLL